MFMTGVLCTVCGAQVYFLYCYERDFISDLHKSKCYDPIDMFNDTSRYLEFEKHIPDIYPADLQLNKARNFFLGFKYKSYWQ